MSHVTTEQWQRVKALFAEALEQPPAERRAWLARACGGDFVIGSQAEALLDAYDEDPSYLEQPAVVQPEDLASVLESADGHLPPGTVLGDRQYQIVGEIGRGGMGVVYVAHDLRLARRVALKALPAQAQGDATRLERFRREAWAAARVSHPAIATIHAFEVLNGQPYIVSEYVRGHTLRSEIERGAIEADRALRIALDIARALVAAHEQQVVHRDLKPENVMLVDDGGVKIVDFGIAQLAEGDTPRLTQEGIRLGTPAYMAPEQFDEGPVDARADIYAFGLILVEMLSGTHPLRPLARQSPAGGGPTPGVDRAGSARRSSVPEVEGLPPGIARIADRCLHVLPAQRYESARDLLQDLRQVMVTPPAITLNQPGSARWWWEFHQVATAVVYWVVVAVGWRAWGLIDAIESRLGLLFIVTLIGAVVVSANLRLNLWFTSRFFPAQLPSVRQQMHSWIRAGDWVFVAVLVSAGILILSGRSTPGRPVEAVVLVAVGVGAAVAFSLIEPATERAAFDPPRDHR